VHTFERSEGEGNATNQTRELNAIKKMFYVVVKMKFPTNKYSQTFNRVSPGYGGMAAFIIVRVDKCVGFPGEGHNFSFM
jgi:hypothetical protein